MRARWIQIVRKEFVLELRKRAVVAGLLLYLSSVVFIITLSFARSAVSPFTWNALFWLALLFSTLHTIGKSFLGERRGAFIYYYYTCPPHTFLVGKLVYHALLAMMFAFVTYGLFILFLQDPVQDRGVFLLLLCLSSMGFAGSLTLISSLASRAANAHVLMAVLSFPVIVSVLLLSVRVTKNCIDGLGWAASADELGSLVGINVLSASLSYLLFPYIWRS